VAGLRRAAVQVLETTEADFRRALEVQATLVEREQTGAAWSALVVAATAERHGAVLLHCDGGLDVTASVTQQVTDRVAR